MRGNASDLNRGETIEETAEMVTARGGVGIAVRTDHTQEEEVKALFERIRQEQGKLDLLVNDIWGGEKLTHWGTPFWEQPLSDGLLMQERAIRTHLITSHYAVPLMIEYGKGLIIEVTDGSTYNYRGNLYYSLVKISQIHLAVSMAEELRPHQITAVSLTPGFLRSEQMLEYFGVDEANWQDAVKKEPHYIESETPYFVGKAVAALAADLQVNLKSGQALTSWDLSDEYGYCDEDGRKPHWGNYAKKQGLPIH
ncbi:7-alpha-hydroxysteroid dehydrogenase [compost metagenome]